MSSNESFVIVTISLFLISAAAWADHNPGHNAIARGGVVQLSEDLQEEIAARRAADEALQADIDALEEETTLSDLGVCDAGEVAKSNGAGGWFCADDDVGDGVIADTLSGLDCAQGDVIVFSDGQWLCASDLVPADRFTGNGDGTVTDNETGLMWEKKLSETEFDCANEDQVLRDVRCVQNEYAWTADGINGTAPNGTLYTDFLARLNLDATTDPNATCFANHCDWRIPNIRELQTILRDSCTLDGNACIDEIFGPTQARGYWSSSTFATDHTSAWHINFNSGSVFTDSKSDKDEFNPGINFARAVRGGR